MARLHEYQGKAILAANGFKIPRGRAASTADEAVAAAKELIDGKKSGEVVVKIQVWTTGRAGIGGVAFAKRPADVRGHAARMLAMKAGQFPVEAVLVEEKIAIEREFFLSFAIDDAARAPVIIVATGGGSGIEERAASTRRIACDMKRGPLDSAVKEAVASSGLSSAHAAQLRSDRRRQRNRRARRIDTTHRLRYEARTAGFGRERSRRFIRTFIGARGATQIGPAAAAESKSAPHRHDASLAI